ncbi:hypothetical protein QYE76_061845 [Lolium multiflorum]|uniref:CCHC-type domain-containing protein n=1 Tax=Lolium multiflorum TaxID=4521 RepID=A0AAD8S451_LOLMU|nr:hypothetical protein QYE76_061845 [Lolium multiflorum]
MSATKLTKSVGSDRVGEIDGMAPDDLPGELGAEASASAESRKEVGIDTMFDHLAIDESEFDDFVIEEDEDITEASTRWMAVARVLCGKKFSHEALLQQMQIAWNPAREINMRPVGENRFVIQCFCLGDWEKVMERGPWLFRDWPLIIAEYHGFSDPESVELSFSPMWIQVHKVPEGFRKKEVLQPLITRTCGKIVTLEMIPSGSFRGDFVRARIHHDVRKPLARFVSLVRGGKRFVYAVKYEKLGLICYACGLIGHDHKECGIGVYEEKELKYGEWIYVNPPSSRQRGPSGLRGGLRGGRAGHGDSIGGRTVGMDAFGRGRGGGIVGGGRGSYVDWRVHPERDTRSKDKGDKDLMDTATSPAKPGDIVMSEAEKSAKKRLQFGPGMQELNTGAGVGENALALIDSNNSSDQGKEQAGVKESKRHKREDGTSYSGSAASQEDDRRTQ